MKIKDFIEKLWALDPSGEHELLVTNPLDPRHRAEGFVVLNGKLGDPAQNESNVDCHIIVAESYIKLTEPAAEEPAKPGLKMVENADTNS